MQAYLAVFLCALFLSMVLTPMARTFGIRIGAMDIPDDRKHHTHPKPRTGGLAILISFFAALTLALAIADDKVQQFILQPEALYFAAGAMLCFLVGFVDDLKRQRAIVKLAGQIVATSLAFYGGVRINLLPIAGIEIPLWFSYIQTLLWFLLFINAINLIDGLDGLAAGICLFTSLMLVVLSLMRGSSELALPFVALAGTLFGFLRYNFNPSTIFMGDGGSYFLGFVIAGLAVLGSAKGQVGAVFLLPFIGMGVPIFDTLFTPVRRFVLGRKVFSPDNGHIHHKLIAMGLTTRKAVLSLYLLTTVFGLVSIVVVNMRDELLGFVLILCAAGMFFLYRTLGNGHMTLQGLRNWFRDMADVAGLSKERRMFLDHQLKIHESTNISALWSNACDMLDTLSIDFAELRLDKPGETNCSSAQGGTAQPSLVLKCPSERLGQHFDLCRPGLLKLELPLITSEGRHLGQVWIIKDIMERPIDPTTLMRLELFRRTVIKTLVKIPYDYELN